MINMNWLMLQTTVVVDWGIIVQSVMQAVIVLVPMMIGLIKIVRQGNSIHTLVNDQLTREKETRLSDLQTNKMVLAKLIGNTPNKAEMAVLYSLEKQIENLAEEVRKRDAAAASLLKTRKRDL